MKSSVHEDIHLLQMCSKLNNSQMRSDTTSVIIYCVSELLKRFSVSALSDSLNFYHGFKELLGYFTAWNITKDRIRIDILIFIKLK